MFDFDNFDLKVRSLISGGVYNEHTSKSGKSKNFTVVYVNKQGLVAETKPFTR